MITRPRFQSVPLSVGLRWRGGAGFLFEEKIDGRWHVETLPRAVVIGELLSSGRFIAFDCLELDGRSLNDKPLAERLAALDTLALPRPARGNGGEFLEAVLARGGEGVVAKNLAEPFGATWWKCKRFETFDLVITELNPWSGSVRLAESGEDRGWCAAKAVFDSLRVGQVIEVAAYGLTARGKLREPRFVRVRLDK